MEVISGLTRLPGPRPGDAVRAARRWGSRLRRDT